MSRHVAVFEGLDSLVEASVVVLDPQIYGAVILNAVTPEISQELEKISFDSVLLGGAQSNTTITERIHALVPQFRNLDEQIDTKFKHQGFAIKHNSAGAIGVLGEAVGGIKGHYDNAQVFIDTPHIAAREEDTFPGPISYSFRQDTVEDLIRVFHFFRSQQPTLLIHPDNHIEQRQPAVIPGRRVAIAQPVGAAIIIANHPFAAHHRVTIRGKHHRQREHRSGAALLSYRITPSQSQSNTEQTTNVLAA